MAEEKTKDATRTKILVVDDMPHNIKLLFGYLKNLDFEVATAINGKEALEAIERSTPDIVLLDVQMPIMDGYEVCRTLREDPRWADLPVIFLTARDRTDDIVKGFECGASDYLAKPFQFPELMARVHTHLELKRARDEQKRLIRELQRALTQVKTLRGLLPICCNCKKIRDDEGYWEQIDSYIREHSEAEFTHTLCPICAKELYPELEDLDDDAVVENDGDDNGQAKDA